MSYPIFYVEDIPFKLIAREGAATYDLVVVTDIGGQEIAWNDLPEKRSIIVEDFNEEFIMAKGGRRAFIEWGIAEAKKRAKAHVLSMKPPPPNQADKVASAVWNLQYSVHATPDNLDLVIAPAPLP